MPASSQFLLFRDSHPIIQRMVSGHDWSFIATGAGARTVVVLPGGGGDAESMFPVVAGLDPICRVIAIGYPATATKADEIVEGIRGILDDCGVPRACLLGHSLGGMIGRAFAATYPDRVDALIIANCAVYSPGRTAFFKIVLPIMARLPRPVLKWAIRSTFERLLKGQPDREFWLDYVNQTEAMKPQSPMLQNQALCLCDFLRHEPPTPAHSDAGKGRVLLLESDHETGFTAAERQTLRALYPDATVHVFQQAGHLSFITHTEEFVKTVADFLTLNKT